MACMLLNKHHRLLDELTLSRIEIQASELEAALPAARRILARGHHPLEEFAIQTSPK